MQAGHLWVFSNEIDVAATPLKNFQPGSLVTIESARGSTLGTGYINPRSLIAARLCSRDASALTPDWFVQRLQNALQLRESFYAEPWYRLVHGEGDHMPGLVIDRFDRTLVVQITTAGMEQHTDTLIDALVSVVAPESILLRNDSPVRELEGLPSYQRAAVGSMPESISVRENALVYEVPWMSGQKTGWFYDHRDNRAALAPLVANRRVLDCYSYMGAWACNALAQGADYALCVDSSASAITAAQNNAELNQFTGQSARGQLETRCGDAVEVLRDLRHQREQFDVIILDPPAFIKRRKDFRAGLAHYELNHRLAVALLNEGGVIVSASCSQPLSASDLSGAMLKGARKHGYELQLLHSLGQARDHPVHAAMPETHYLKGFAGRLGSGRTRRLRQSEVLSNADTVSD